MIKKYGLVIGLLLVSVPALAMEDGSGEDGSPDSAKPATVVAPAATKPMKRPLIMRILFPFQRFNTDPVRQLYMQEMECWFNQHKSNPGALNENDQFILGRMNHLFNKGEGDDTDRKILLFIYGRKCFSVRTILKCAHWYPYNIVFYSVWYVALITAAQKGYQTIHEYWPQEEQDHSQYHRSDQLHPNCAWCQVRQQKQNMVRNNDEYKDNGAD